MIKIIIADDNLLVREGLRHRLKSESDIQIVSEVSSGIELLEILPLLSIDVILMDIDMPGMGGIEATRHITQNFSGVKVLGFSILDSIFYLKEMLNAGAVGYVVQSAGFEELITAIRQTASGKCFISPVLNMKLINHNDVKSSLTERETQVLKLLADGYTNKLIADKLNISKRTVETHRQNLIDKTKSRNSFELIKFGIFNGIIQLN